MNQPSDRIVIIGGGIAGVQAALDAANAGSQVTIIERSPSLGGVMAALDKNFPTLDCSICIEAPKLSEVSEHPNIEIVALAEVTGLTGTPGQFTVTIRQKNRWVANDCTRCNDCAMACPTVRSNEFDEGMAVRKAIYTPFPQSVPGAYTIDMEACVNEPPIYLPCSRCQDACGVKAISFDGPADQTIERKAAAVIVAAGYEMIDPHLLKEFGYGTSPDIVTGMEYERLLISAGPTGGEIVRPSDRQHPHRLSFVLCAGSRDVRFQKSCTRFCCMYTLKHAIQSVDHGVPDVTVYYMDLRAYGKGFDAFWERAKAAGVKFVRGRPARISASGYGLAASNGHAHGASSGVLKIRVEDTLKGEVEVHETDLVVLATGGIPSSGLPDLAQALGIEVETDGFLRGVARDAGATATTREGVYACGCANGFKDIPDSVASASAASAEALAWVKARAWGKPEQGEPLSVDGEPRVGVFICDCGSNVAGVVNVPEVVEYAKKLGGVVYAEENRFSCAGNTQAEIAKKIRELKLNRVVIAACSPKTHAGTFQRTCMKAGLNPFLMEMSNIRNHASWVHKHDHPGATQKSKDLVHMAVQKANRLEPLEMLNQPMTQRGLVIGGGIAGLMAAANLARQGFEVHLVEQEKDLGGQLRFVKSLQPHGVDAQALVRSAVKLVETSGVKVHAGTKIEQIGGHVGQFHATLSTGEELEVGTVILATGSQPVVPTAFGYGTNPRVMTNFELEQKLSSVTRQHVVMIGCVGSREGERGCSRYCCAATVHQARQLRKQGNEVDVVFRDIRTFGRGAEDAYAQAMAEGVRFYKISPDDPPEKAVTVQEGNVKFVDALSGRPQTLAGDLVVLAVGLTPHDQGIAKQLKVTLGPDGFLFEKHPKLAPVEASSPGIFLAGSAQGPKGVEESIAQGLATASKASELLSSSTIEKEPLTAWVDTEKCTGCSLCVRVCPFNAIEMVMPEGGDGAAGGEGSPKKKGKAHVITAACMGCGTCAAECNFFAITTPSFTDDQIVCQIDAALEKDPEKKVLVFACNWCSYAGADQAGVEKIGYPTSSRIIRTMCSGRISQKFVTHAFEKGAGAVLVTGCHPADCHYINANVHTEKRYHLWKKKFERQGIAPERFQLHWVSASEGKSFAKKMKEMHEIVEKHAASKVVTHAT